MSLQKESLILWKTTSHRSLLPGLTLKQKKALQVRWKLNLFLQFKAIFETSIQVGDPVQMYIKLQDEKRETWCGTRPVLEYEHKSRTVIVPNINSRTQSAAKEDVRSVHLENAFADASQASMDTLDDELTATI